MASQTPFTLENLRKLDFGKIGVAFDVEREHVVKDCMDRPGDSHARVILMKFLFAPIADAAMGAPDCERVRFECEISSNLPKRRTRVYEMSPTVNGGLMFNPDLPLEPDEDTIFHEQERKEDEGE